jgi:hypothetical protein
MTKRSPDRGVRTGASILAATLQILSGLSIAATLFATYAVSRLGTQLGVGTSHNPAAWIVFATGFFFSLMLLAAGYILDILCVIYDRQEPGYFGSPPAGPRPPLSAPPQTFIQPSQPTTPRTNPLNPPSMTLAPEEERHPGGLSEASISSDARSTGLWYELTRKRQWFGRSGN